MGIMLIDSHCHIIDSDRELWSRIESSSNIYCVMSSTIQDFQKVADMKKRFPTKIISAFGIHPWKVTNLIDNCKDFFQIQDLKTFSEAVELVAKTLEQFLLADETSIIGEIGLDNYAKIPGEDRIHDFDQQVQLFEMQFYLALKLGKPISIHCVKAQGFLLDFLGKQSRIPKVMMHSYGGSRESIRQLSRLPRGLGANIFYSFSSLINARKSKVDKIIQAVPSDRLLIETDVSQIEIVEEELGRTLEFVASNLGITKETLVEIIQHNQEAFFIAQNKR